MAEYLQSTPEQTLSQGQNLLFNGSNPCRRGCVVHRDGSGVFTLRGAASGCNCFARYNVEFTGNVAVPEGGTVQAVAVALTLDGEPLQFSRAIVTPAAAEQYFNVKCSREIDVPKGCCYTLAVEGVNAGVGEDIAYQAPSVADGNLEITRTA